MLTTVKHFGKLLAIGLAGMLLSACIWIAAAFQTSQPAQANAPQRNAYFGDLHTHTIYSLDAYMGFMRNDPDDAYKFAKGEPNEVPGGITQHKVPLDFAAVTDHAEFIGEMEMALNPEYGKKKYYSPAAIAIRNQPQSEALSALVFVKVVQGANRSEGKPERTPFGSGPVADTARVNAWRKIQQATEDNYEPDKFTTLYAFEWSSAPGGANLHRNVIFKDKWDANGKDVLPITPLSAFDTQAPEELWQTLSEYEANGATVLAIPHNSNASANLMFMPERFTGVETADNCNCEDDETAPPPEGPVYDDSPIDTEWAEMQAKYEPLVEIMQIKGTSETLPAYAPNDEFANFELMDLTSRTHGRYGYLREALKNGLRHEEALGANPFKYGIIGATDNHNGSPGDTEEDDYIGSHGYTDATPALRQFSEIPGWESLPYLNPGALTGVWAEANRREPIYNALARKETFATSGNRTKVRFFGGWNFPSDLDQQTDAVDYAYENGVPMGGDLPLMDGAAPTFMVWATKDPAIESGNLDRIQVVKGWTKHGLTHEQIYDVVWAPTDKNGNTREINGNTGKLSPIGSTVDVLSGSFTNTIGEAELSEVWTDPDFDPTVRTFYYLRALEIPTPRYSTRDAAELGIVPNPISATEIQERAWSSPIWYTPSPEDLAAGEAEALTVDKVTQDGFKLLTTQQIKKLVRGNDLQIANRVTDEAFIGFFQKNGTWFLGESASSAPLHTGELEAAAPLKYTVADNEPSFNLKDGSEFTAQLFQKDGRVLAAREDEIGYVNYELKSNIIPL